MTIHTWTPERVDQLRNCVVAGLTCSQIAAEIGVTRNAVIGKINRLGLSPGRTAGAPARSCPPRVQRPRLSSPRRLLRLMTAAASSFDDDVSLAFGPVDNTQRCSLLELSHDKCRWPIAEPGTADFAFCGHEVVKGFSYCASHARMAYRLPAHRSR
jgi:GcrA cell cycle regulator